MSHCLSAITVLGAVLLYGVLLPGGASIARADDAALRQSLESLVQQAAQSLGEEIARTINNKDTHRKFIDSFVEAVAKHYGQRIGELEKAVAERDREIAGLKEKLNVALAAGKAAETPASEPKKPSGAFLGVGHVDDPHGARVTTIHEGSPAARAGLKTDDVIAKVDGHTVESAKLSELLGNFDAGAAIKLLVLRGSDKLEIEAKLTDRDQFFTERETAARKAAEAAAQPKAVVLGIEVETVDGAVEVMQVDDGFTGHVAGLAVGDKILEVNGAPVASTEAIVAEMKKVKAGDEFSLVTQRAKEIFEIKAVGSATKEGAKLVERRAVEVKDTVAKETQPAPAPSGERKPAHIGVSVEEKEMRLVVTDVVPGTGAAVWGVQTGDVVLAVGGSEVKSIEQLKEIASKLRAGDRITIVVQRGDARIEIADILLGARGETVQKSGAAAAAASAPAGKRPTIGLSAYEDKTSKAVFVKDLVAGGSAAKSGLKPGDQIVSVGGKAVASFADFESALGAASAADGIAIAVKRNGADVEIRLTAGD